MTTDEPRTPTNDSTYPSPRETPGPSSFPSPPGGTTPTTSGTEGAASREPTSADSADKPPPKRTRARKKTTRRKSTRSRSRSKPTIDPGKPGAAARSKPAKPEEPKLSPADVRKLLDNVGETAHYLGCDALAIPESENPELFRFTKDELDDLAEPVARIVARHAALARLAEKSDETLVTFALGKYVFRNMAEARAAVALANSELPDVEVAPLDNEGGRDSGVVDEARGIPTSGG